MFIMFRTLSMFSLVGLMVALNATSCLAQFNRVGKNSQTRLQKNLSKIMNTNPNVGSARKGLANEQTKWDFKNGFNLAPGGKSRIFSQKSSASVMPSARGADWRPMTNIFQSQPGRAGGGDSGLAISIRFTGAGVVEPVPLGYALNAHVGVCSAVGPSNPNEYFMARLGSPVRIPDGDTVVRGDVKSAGSGAQNSNQQ